MTAMVVDTQVMPPLYAAACTSAPCPVQWMTEPAVLYRLHLIFRAGAVARHESRRAPIRASHRAPLDWTRRSRHLIGRGAKMAAIALAKNADPIIQNYNIILGEILVCDVQMFV